MLQELVMAAGLMMLIGADLLPSRLRIVDSNPKANTFLVRGNLPINSKRQFQMDELQSNLVQLTNLKRFKLVVINFMNHLTPKQTKNSYIQQKYFEKNSHLAEYKPWIVLGAITDPTQMPNWLARMLNYLGNFDQLDNLLEYIRSILYKSSNTIVYIHCSAGVDRTGLVSGAYKMRYKGASFKQVMVQNLDVLKGHRKYMIFNAQNGLQWYCYSLTQSQQACKINDS